MLKDIIIKRHSCRKYVEKWIDKDLVYSCIDAARLAPSACKSPSWMFYVVLDEMKRKEMVE